MAAAALSSFALFVAMLFVMPVIEKSWRGRIPPAPTQFVIDLSTIVRLNLVLPVPTTSWPVLLALLGFALTQRGWPRLGAALLRSGLVLGISALALIALVLLT